MAIRLNYKSLLTTSIALIGLYFAWIPASQEFFGKSLTLENIVGIEIGTKLTDPIKDVKLVVAGEEIVVPTFTLFELKNDGAKPITPEDFVSEIEISTSNDTKIIRVVPYDSSEALISMSIVSNKIKMSKSLLNPNDSVLFKVLTSGKKPTFKVNARIVGVSEIKLVSNKFKVPPTKSTVFKFVDLFVIGSLIFLASIPMFRTSVPTPYYTKQLFFLSCICSSIAVFPFDHFSTFNVRIEKFALSLLLVVTCIGLSLIYSKKILARPFTQDPP